MSVTHCDGCIMVARAGQGAAWDDLLVRRRRAPLRLNVSAALRQVVVDDLILFVGNLLAEPEGDQRPAKGQSLAQLY